MRVLLKRWLKPAETVKDLNWSTVVNIKITITLAILQATVIVINIIDIMRH